MYNKDKHTLLRKYENKFYLVAPRATVYECNEIVARIYDLCNGLNSMEDMVDKLLEIYDVDKTALRNDVEKCSLELEELLYICQE